MAAGVVGCVGRTTNMQTCNQQTGQTYAECDPSRNIFILSAKCEQKDHSNKRQIDGPVDHTVELLCRQSVQ